MRRSPEQRASRRQLSTGGVTDTSSQARQKDPGWGLLEFQSRVVTSNWESLGGGERWPLSGGWKCVRGQGVKAWIGEREGNRKEGSKSTSVHRGSSPRPAAQSMKVTVIPAHRLQHRHHLVFHPDTVDGVRVYSSFPETSGKFPYLRL